MQVALLSQLYRYISNCAALCLSEGDLIRRRYRNVHVSTYESARWYLLGALIVHCMAPRSTRGRVEASYDTLLVPPTSGGYIERGGRSCCRRFPLSQISPSELRLANTAMQCNVFVLCVHHAAF
jgi:hypothetical protein